MEDTSPETIEKDDGVSNDMTADKGDAGEEKGAELGEASVAPSAGPAPSTTILKSTNVLGSQVKEAVRRRKKLSLLKKAVPPTALYTADNAALRLRFFQCQICQLPADSSYQCETCYAHQHEMCADVTDCPKCKETARLKIPPAPTTSPVLPCDGVEGFETALGYEVGVGSSLLETSSPHSLALAQTLLLIQGKRDSILTEPCTIPRGPSKARKLSTNKQKRIERIKLRALLQATPLRKKKKRKDKEALANKLTGEKEKCTGEDVPHDTTTNSNKRKYVPSQKTEDETYDATCSNNDKWDYESGEWGNAYWDVDEETWVYKKQKMTLNRKKNLTNKSLKNRVLAL